MPPVAPAISATLFSTLIAKLLVRSFDDGISGSRRVPVLRRRDAYGMIFSVMKRAYLFVDSGQAQLTDGYKVGDLETVYIGQVQTKPTIVGFIEGGPPIPSENQTKPFWKGPLSEYNSYDNAGSVEFEE